MATDISRMADALCEMEDRAEAAEAECERLRGGFEEFSKANAGLAPGLFAAQDEVRRLKNENAAYVEAYDLLAKQGKADNEKRIAAEAECQNQREMKDEYEEASTLQRLRAERAEAENKLLIEAAKDMGVEVAQLKGDIGRKEGHTGRDHRFPAPAPCLSCRIRAALETK